jgi:hypothetical protein
METRTTAQLRNLAREAEERGNYLTASELYQLAVTRYPVYTNSSLARADIAGLRDCARRCLFAHQQREVVPDTSDPMVTTIRAALDDQQRARFEAEYNKQLQVIEHALPERAQ